LTHKLRNNLKYGAMTVVNDLRLICGWLLDHIRYIDSKYARHFEATQKISMPVKS
jgi:hemerythrin